MGDCFCSKTRRSAQTRRAAGASRDLARRPSALSPPPPRATRRRPTGGRSARSGGRSRRGGNSKAPIAPQSLRAGCRVGGCCGRGRRRDTRRTRGPAAPTGTCTAAGACQFANLARPFGRRAAVSWRGFAPSMLATDKLRPRAGCAASERTTAVRAHRRVGPRSSSPPAPSPPFPSAAPASGRPPSSARRRRGRSPPRARVRAFEGSLVADRRRSRAARRARAGGGVSRRAALRGRPARHPARRSCPAS